METLWSRSGFFLHDYLHKLITYVLISRVLVHVIIVICGTILLFPRNWANRTLLYLAREKKRMTLETEFVHKLLENPWKNFGPCRDFSCMTTYTS
jgi:hypothetical protein